MELLSQLGIDPLILLAQVVNFLLLLGLLWKFLYKPLTRILRERRVTIRKSLRNAKKIDEDLKTSRDRARAIVNQANLEVDKLNAKNEQVLAEKRRERLRTVESEAAEVFKRTQESINEERKNMEQEVQNSAIELVGEATSSVLGKSLDIKAQRELIADSIEEVGKKIS